MLRLGRIGRSLLQASGLQPGLAGAWSQPRCFVTGGFLDRDVVHQRVAALFGKLAEDMPALKGAKVEADSALGKDLGLDSLEQTEVLMAVEEEFGVEFPDSVIDKVVSIQDIVDVVSTDPRAK